MAIENTFFLDVDIKQKIYINEPRVTQNDEVTYILRVVDDGIPFDLSGVTVFTLVSVRPDKQSVQSLGTMTANNEVTFKLGTTEIAVPGRVDATIQLYDADGRVSSIPFTYTVLKDPVSDYVPSDDEKTLIEVVLGEGPLVIQQANEARDEANQAAAYADNERQLTQTEREATILVRQATEEERIATIAAKEATEQATADTLITKGQAEEAALYATQEADDAKAQKEIVAQVIKDGPVASVNGQTGMVTGLAKQVEVDSLTTALADMVYPGEYFNERLKSGNQITIKLIGDSITAGQGATGYKVDSTNPAIFTDTLGVTQYEASYNSLSWANKFRNYMLAKNPLNIFKNWGIGGKSTSYWVTNKAQIVNEDVVFVMIGTNDRTGSLLSYRTNLINLLTHIKVNSNYVVVMAANPLSTLVETYAFTNEEAAKTMTEICIELNLPLINHYEGFMEFSKFGNVYTDFLSDGIHPNDAGHELIWNTIQDNLSFYDVKYRENLLNYYKVLPSNFGGFSTAFDGRQHIMPTNIHKNAILDSWTAGIPTESTKSSGLVVEQVPAFFKGKYAAKLTSTSANSYFTFPLSINNTKENAKMLLSYRSKGAARIAVYQNGVTDALLDTWLEEGQFNKVFDLPFKLEGVTGFFVRIWPDVTMKSGFTIVDTLAVVKNQHYNYGFFTDESRVNVRWFGVSGDGTVETPLITTMIQQMGVGPTNPGYTLYFPKGNYTIGNLANMNKKVVVEGDGYETVFERPFTNAVHKNLRVVNAMRNDIVQTSLNGTSYLIGIDDAGERTKTPWTYS